MENKFDQILDKDEEIIKVFKPNKLKLVVSSLLASFMVFGWLFILLAVGVFTDGFDVGYGDEWIVLTAVLGSAVLLIALAFLIIHLYYKNIFYAYSNKRIIIRTGIFGVDYKSLDMSMIGAVNVNVSLMDKLLRKNTGTITFGSMASPMMSAQGVGNAYRFANITMPYEVYKEVKDIIHIHKEKSGK